MKVLVAGATGVVGWRAVRELVAAGHDVTAVARTQKKADRVVALGGAPVSLDLFDGAAVLTHAAAHDAVVNLATHIPPTSKAMLPGAWRENDRLRTEASAHLAAAALAGGGRFIQESITFTYADNADGWIDETSPIDTPPFVDSVRAAEAAAGSVTGGGGAGVVLRFGQFYGPDSAHTAEAVAAARRGVAAAVGQPTGYVSFINTDDAARAVLAALAAPAGVFNVVDDDPLPKGEAFQALADALGKRRSSTLGGRALAHVGGSRMNLLARSQRVSNAAFKQATGWTPRVRSVRDGWAIVLKEMSDEES